MDNEDGSGKNQPDDTKNQNGQKDTGNKEKKNEQINPLIAKGYISRFSGSGEITMIANAIAVALAKQLTINEQNILGNILELAGADLLTMASIDEAFRESITPQSSGTEDEQVK